MKRILKVQQEIGKLSKNSSNPFFKSQYLDLNDLIEQVKPILNSNGLILLQPITEGNVISQIVDAENGNVITESSLALPNESNPQKMGSCITYFRRYTLKSLLAIAETDDDGNLAAKPKEPIDYAKQLKEATTLVGLAGIWKAIPNDVKPNFESIKNDVKGGLR